MSAITTEQSAALSEFTVDEYMDSRGDDARAVRKIRIKVHDQLRPLVELGKHLGMFKNHQPTSAQPEQGRRRRARWHR